MRTQKEQNGWKIWDIDDSSRVSRVEFKKTKMNGILSAGELILTFKNNGSQYLYHNVPEMLVMNAVNAESIGKALNTIINNKKIKYEKIGGANPDSKKG